MQLWKRGGEAFNFAFTNPIIFLVYLPITLLGLLSVYVDFNSTLNSILAVLYILVMLALTSFVFTFLILKAAYRYNKKEASFRQIVDFSASKFLSLLLAEFILIVGIILISSIINFVAILWTSNLGIAVSIVLAVFFISLLLKFLLFAPSCVLKGDMGFGESWNIVGWKEFFELAIFIALYAFLSFGLSYLPYAGYLIDSLILGPVLMVIVTFLYLDYLKK